MDRWMKDEWAGGRTDGQIHAQVGGVMCAHMRTRVDWWMDEQVVRQTMDGWMDEGTDGCRDGWICEWQMDGWI